MRAPPLPVWRSLAALRAQVRAWRAASETLALVPTMGALHAGHVALITEGQQRTTRTIASIFVNPAQFAPSEDFKSYPRTFENDCAKLAAAGAAGCYAPDVEDMYPVGFATSVLLQGPATAQLDDRTRPTHFAGVATVVAKLLCQVAPDVAVFGEKDFQQLLVVRRMVRDLDLPVEIVGLPTVREVDGLALSSRNAYLSPHERQIAPLLHATLDSCARAIRSGTDIEAVLSAARREIGAAGFDLDYLEARDSETLAPLTSNGSRPLRLLVAAKLGTTRLIDNLGV